MSAALLAVEGLAVHFPIAVGGLLRRRYVPLKALDGVSFELHRGETLGIVGESGCGKSTLGRAVLRLIEPSAGRVVWLGHDLAALDPEALRRQRGAMQIVFQDPLASLSPRMTVGDIIAEPLITHEPGLGRAEVRARVAEMLAKTGLSPQMVNRYPHEFSGGQCQRIGITRAMILRPKLIVCDEPVSALDVSIRAQIVNLLMRLQREFGLALLFISHDLAVVRHISHPHPGALSRPDDGAGRSRVPVPDTAPSLHQGADLGGAAPGSQVRAPEAPPRAHRRPAVAAQPAVWLRVPHPLRAGDRAVRPGGSADRAERARSPGRLPPLA
jgi:ABC-type oligopeptide transport system ATPase subunit